MHFTIPLALLLASSVAMANPPAPPAPNGPLLGALSGANAEALSPWRPMGDTAPAEAVQLEGTHAFRMPCNFAGTDIERAAWDCDLPIDLSQAHGLQFQFHCADPEPVSGFTVYLRSGKGWYSTHFYAPAPMQWDTVRVEKAVASAEGVPNGWGKIDRIRVCAWRGADVDTEFHIAHVGIMPAAGEVVLLRGEWAARQVAGEARSVQDYAQVTAQHLNDLGIPYVPVADLDLTAKQLEGKRLVILPYNPALPAAARDALDKHLQGGGAVLACYTVVESGLASALGLASGRHTVSKNPGEFASMHRTETAPKGYPAEVRQRSWNIRSTKPLEGRGQVAAYWHSEDGTPTEHPAVIVTDRGAFISHVLMRDDPAGKRHLLLSLIGHFLPSAWNQAVEKQLGRVGEVGPHANLAEAEKGIRAAAKTAKATELLDEALALHRTATEHAEAGEHTDALEAAAKAGERLLDAYCAVQQPLAGEHRAFWCHDARGVSGKTWDDAIRILAENGFTAILPNMLWGGAAYYKSEVLPVAPAVAGEGDQVALCLAACKKYGIECHVWKVNWNMGGKAPAAFKDKMAKDGRTQALYDGEKKTDWLCPSHPQNQQLEIDAMVEVATQYDVDGVHFDYIRYPSRNGCFCAGCRSRFEKMLGKPVPNWPKGVRDDSAIEAEWNAFRRSHITHVVAEVSKQLRETRPDVEISAAVFRNWPADRDEIGQDWGLWCEKGYLDFVCPMDYVHNNAQFETMVQRQQQWVGDVPCYPGIGLSVWPGADRMPKLIDQIKITRRLSTGGFTIFNYSVQEAAEILPRCGLGITRPE